MKKSTDISNDYFKTWLEEESSTPENNSIDSGDAIIRFVEAHAVVPPESLKQVILQKIKSLEAAESNRQLLDINDLPLLDSKSNWLDWQTCVQHLSTPDNYDGIHLHPLVASPGRDLFVAWVKEYVEEEVHDDLVESFMVLEGNCECSIHQPDGSTLVVRMTAGDYLEIPVGAPHNLVITSLTPVKAILQWMKLSA